MKFRSWLVVFILALCVAGTVRAQSTDPFVEGFRLYEEKKFAEALVKFREALKWVPDDPTVLSWIGATHMSLAQYADAEKVLTAAIDNGGTTYKYFELLTLSQINQSRWDAALTTIRRYRDATDDADEQENDEKLRNLESALHLEKRLVYLKQSPPDKESAAKEADAAWNLHPKDVTQYAQFAQIWLGAAVAETDAAKKADLYARAESAARTWLASGTGPDVATVRVILGTALLRQKKFDEAIRVLGEACTAEPTNCRLKLEVTRAHLGKEDYVQAKIAATEAITCDPNDPQGYFLRAVAFRGLDDCPSVVKDGADYVRRSPGKEEPRFITYCKELLAYKKGEEEDRKKRYEEYKKWILQQLEPPPEE